MEQRHYPWMPFHPIPQIIESTLNSHCNQYNIEKVETFVQKPPLQQQKFTMSLVKYGETTPFHKKWLLHLMVTTSLKQEEPVLNLMKNIHISCKHYSWGFSHKRKTAKLKICCGVYHTICIILSLDLIQLEYRLKKKQFKYLINSIFQFYCQHQIIFKFQCTYPNISDILSSFVMGGAITFL
ncbi:hypothetical protein AGLY_015594 [Aphis glycines]|uniref:Uncharacterized protein n=1 Tax=Aphis glycines TaxID=307491 RepID=A0A6G0T216_APHGL|nr:hypothetical protein AGLY_015594 [Aphis glycines]